MRRARLCALAQDPYRILWTSDEMEAAITEFYFAIKYRLGRVYQELEALLQLLAPIKGRQGPVEDHVPK